MCESCHTLSVDLEITSIAALIAACNKLGWNLHEGRHKWYGTFVGDSPVPDHFFTPDEYAAVMAMPKADRNQYLTDLFNQSTYAISVPGRDYEIGVFERNGQYKLLWDNWRDGGILFTFDPLLQEYTLQKTLMEAASQGHHVDSVQKADDGSLKITINVPQWEGGDTWSDY